MSSQTIAPRPLAMTGFAWAQLFLLGAIWGASFFFARIAVQVVPPLTLVLFRVAIAALALHLYCLHAASISGATGNTRSNLPGSAC